jgi:hypothetical protein
VVDTTFADGVQAGNFVSLSVEATNAAGTTGDVTVTVDPMGLGRSTFVQRFLNSSGFNQGPCPTGKQCFFDSVRVDIRLAPGD